MLNVYEFGLSFPSFPWRNNIEPQTGTASDGNPDQKCESPQTGFGLGRNFTPDFLISAALATLRKDCRNLDLSKLKFQAIIDNSPLGIVVSFTHKESMEKYSVSINSDGSVGYSKIGE